ncbi:DUF2127 domain-containing protein [Uliginosibacterium sp. sgz301328]|uniref:DUF2127 domain-containing protein n=1 Tax=Uliginosibacterium sp. sgz301328 TaxID=3243764 RepID=UPI00359EDDF9
MKSSPTLRLIALFEAAKGAIVLAAGFGLLTLIHADLQTVAENLVRHSHLNPASHYPRIFIDAAARASSGNLWLLALLAAMYSVMRFVEAYGLWFARRWAEWFAVLSAGAFIPVEIYELSRHASWIRGSVLAVNILIVIYLSRRLWRERDV